MTKIKGSLPRSSYKTHEKDLLDGEWAKPIGTTEVRYGEKVNLSNFYRKWLSRAKGVFDPNRTVIPYRLQESIQTGVLNFEYEGIPCMKNPFDLALYTTLLQRLRPELIVEIGSAYGGSAKWFAAQAKGLSLSTKTVSYDINPVEGLDDESVTFHRADIHLLEETNIGSLIHEQSGPVLVIEDGPHTFEACMAALEYFAKTLRTGDYIVVEDGNLRELGYFWLEDGANRAVKTYLKDNPGRLEIDWGLCNFYGRNATGNTNGWLRKL